MTFVVIETKIPAIVGDFTKSVALIPIVRKMHEKLATDSAWKEHFVQLAASVQDTSSEEVDVDVIEFYTNMEESLYRVLLAESERLLNVSFRRERLQTRFFELGNNCKCASCWY